VELSSRDDIKIGGLARRALVLMIWEEAPWPGRLRSSSRFASALRSTATCRPNSDLALAANLMGMTAIALGAAEGERSAMEL
jgi:hypothetical protein